MWQTIQSGMETEEDFLIPPSSDKDIQLIPRDHHYNLIISTRRNFLIPKSNHRWLIDLIGSDKLKWISRAWIHFEYIQWSGFDCCDWEGVTSSNSQTHNHNKTFIMATPSNSTTDRHGWLMTEWVNPANERRCNSSVCSAPIHPRISSCLV